LWSIEHEKFEAAGEKFESSEGPGGKSFQVQIRARHF